MAENWKSGMAEPNYRMGNKIGGKTGKVTGKGNPNGQMGSGQLLIYYYLKTKEKKQSSKK
jgi:hypothetical protein